MSADGSLKRGAAYMVASAFFFAVMGLGVKLLSRHLGNAAVVFFRNAIALAVLLPWVLRRGPRSLATRRLPEHLVRSLAGLTAMYFFFYALAHMRLADAVLLNYSVPLFTPMIAFAWLGERVPSGLGRALLLGFVGIVLVLKPGPGLFQPVALFAVVSAMFAALAQVGVRRLTASEPVTRIVFYFSLISTLCSAPPLLWSWRAPDADEWSLIVAMGIAATAGQLFLTRAYAQAPAAQVGPFIYASVPFAALLDGLVFGSWPDAWSALGACCVAGAGILTLRRSSVPAAPD
jgi:drug/metabolite transporter (DMT)-like permease